MKITNYKQLIQMLITMKALQADQEFECYLNNKVMYAFTKKDGSTSKNEYFAYTFENPVIYDFFYGLVDGANMKQDKYSIGIGSPIKAIKFSVISNKDNKYQFLLNHTLLDLLLTAEMLKAEGKEINHKFQLKTKSKVREIVAPCDEIKKQLQTINKILQLAYDDRNADFQVAYKTGKSIKSNALPHADKQYVFKTDLHNFFPSCQRKYVDKYVSFLFRNAINQDFAKEKFLDIILDNDALFIGSPISGTLANAIISKPAAYIKNICDKFNITFTVYADDMTFSSDNYLSKDFIISIFNRAFVRYGMDDCFSLNEKKCYGVSKCRRAITGVALNDKNQVTCHRYIYNEIRQTLHQLSYGDESHYNYNVLKGKIAFMSMLDESGKLKKLVSKYRDTVTKYSLLSEEKLVSMGV